MRRRTLASRLTLALIAMLATLLVSCGGTPGPSNLFVEENAWTGEIPDGATIITSDEFRRMVGSGELVLRSSADVDAQAEELIRQFGENRDFLAGLTDAGENVADLLAAVAAGADYVGDVGVELDSGEGVILEGLATRLSNAAQDAKLAASASNALSVYAMTYDLLPDDLKPSAPTPGSLAGKPVADVQAAMALIDSLLATVVDLDHTSLDPDFLAPGSGELETQSAGNGLDSGAACSAPTSFVARLWFPLKSFISPIKDQANRGTCWAFTAIGAIESRERVQNGNAVNLSEQFLVNKVKNDWDENDYSDGYSSLKAINTASSKGQAMAPESSWTYNTAPNRADSRSGKAEYYQGTCDPYGTTGGGWCSETAHESPAYCTTVLIFTYCGYKTMTFSGGGVAAGKAVQVWSSGETFNLNNYRNLLAQGHVLMASFPVYEGFMSAPGGVVSDYAKKYIDDKGDLVDGSYGGHAVQIVAFFSNADLSTPSYTYDIGGGGYFVVKNSWGCAAGDGGYYYVPADYVQTRFNSLATLEFDSRRSAAWTKEQTNPGSTEAPAINIRSARPNVDLRVATDISSFFSVTHSVASSVSLVVRSDKDGVLFDGAWNTAQYTFPPVLTRTFTTVGQRTITLRANYAGNVTEKSFVANVVNTAPSLSLSGSGTAYIGEPYSVSATVSDINDAGTAALCSNTTWSIAAPDTLSTTTGCQVTVTYGATGTRTVSATTRDADGLSTTRSLTLDVQPPPVNPYPRVTGYGVYSRTLTSGPLYLCLNANVPAGNTIDFTENGCNFVGETGTHRRYSAFVQVENPDNEALTYDWRVYVTYGGSEHLINGVSGSTDNTFVPYSPGNALLGTEACRIAVTVHAPDPTRSKSLTVWTGSCTYYSTYIG